MIQSHDRSGWFGASDVEKIVGKWGSPSWTDWWMEKLAIRRNNFTTDAMQAGTYWEHRILESLDIPDMEFDKQILLPDLRLRVNLDGNTKNAIYECKTHQADKPFKVPSRYVHQVNVQMFATGIREAYIVAYGLVPEDMANYFRPIEKSRRELICVQYDDIWVRTKFLPRLYVLRDCLVKGVLPSGV